MSAVHIGETIRERFPHVGTERSGQDRPALVDGLPVDRTICPRCLGLEGAREGCHVCGNAPVCPGCRNARVVSVVGPSLRYSTCPECCEPMKDEATGRPQYSDTGVPRWYWYASKQRDAILRYRDRQRFEEVDDVPF